MHNNVGTGTTQPVILLASTALYTMIYSYYAGTLNFATQYSLTVTVPSQVTDVTVSKAVRSGRPALRVMWTTPQSDVSISQYQVQYRRSGTTSWSSAAPVSGSTTSTYLEELVAGSEYQVRVRAVSAIGSGAWSAVQSLTTYRSESFTTEVVILQKLQMYKCT